LEAMTAPRCFG